MLEQKDSPNWASITVFYWNGNNNKIPISAKIDNNYYTRWKKIKLIVDILSFLEVILGMCDQAWELWHLVAMSVKMRPNHGILLLSIVSPEISVSHSLKNAKSVSFLRMSVIFFVKTEPAILLHIFTEKTIYILCQT